MRNARNARSCPVSPVDGSTSAVVSNGIRAGSQCHRNFSGGKLAGFELEFFFIPLPKAATLTACLLCSHPLWILCFYQQRLARRGRACSLPPPQQSVRAL